MARILVLDDDPGVVDLLVDDLGEHGYAAEGCTRPDEALERIRAGAFDLLVSDVEMPGMRGPELLRVLQRERPELLVVLITAFGSVETAVRAMREGASDFVTKPFRIEALLRAIERSLRERSLRREIVRLKSAREPEPGAIVARSASMRRVVELAQRVAATDATLLLTGESGVGKGAVARLVHERSGRAGAFVQVNCAALPAALAEAELFGVRRGAFTDAREDRPGLFSQAHGGTLFLDEIGELPLELQPKLLQALETRRVRPLGGRGEEAVDVRIVAATHRALDEAVREKRFRADLYFRLDVVRLDIPPLRERPDDVRPLVDVLLAAAAARFDRPVRGVSEQALAWLEARPWPGNVRELANAVDRAVVLAEHDTLVLEDFTLGASPGNASLLDEAVEDGLTLDQLEERYVRRVLERTGGNKSEAARILGIDRRTLYRRLEGSG